MQNEIIESGFRLVDQIAIEGFGWLLHDFQEYWDNLSQRNLLLQMIKLVEKEASLMGVSAHVMVVAQKE